MKTNMNDDREGISTRPLGKTTRELLQQYRIYYRYKSKKTEDKDTWQERQAYIWAQNETEARETFGLIHFGSGYYELITKVELVTDNLNLED